MKSVGCLLVGVALIASMLSCVKSNISGITGTGLIWVATQGNQEVTAFTINLSTGAVAQVGSSQPTGVQPSAMAVTPDGKTLFIANTSDNTISAYTVNSDGSLTASKSSTPTLSKGPSGCTNSCMSLGLNPMAMSIDPAGKFLFVAEQGQPTNMNTPGGVSVYAISGTSLTAAGPACPAGFTLSTCPFAMSDPVTGFSTGPSAVVAAPTGNFLYVANTLANTVEGFSYDSTTGALTSLGITGTGTNPSSLAFSRCAGVSSGTLNCASADANTLFVANSGSNTLSSFAACIQVSSSCATPNGSLTQTSGSPIGADISPVAVIVDPAANFIFAVNSRSNTISQYRYSPSNGVLSPLAPPSLATGFSPFGGGVTSDGTYAVVSNNNGSSITVYAITSTGPTGRLALAPTPTVTLAGQPSAIVVR